MKLDFNAKIHNRFDIEVIDTNTGKVKQKAYAENVICDNLWTTMFTKISGYVGKPYFKYIHYGSGTGTPASTDTSLFTFSGYGTPSEADDTYSTDVKNSVVSLTRRIQLSESVSVGVNITEVGIASGTSASTLCTHAMLKDMNGNTISIAKTDTDIINIYATVYAHVFSISDMISRGIYMQMPLDYRGAKNQNWSVRAQLNDCWLFKWMLGWGSCQTVYSPYNTCQVEKVYLDKGNLSGSVSEENTKKVLSSNITIDPATKKVSYMANRCSVSDSNVAKGATCINVSVDNDTSASIYSTGHGYTLQFFTNGSWFTPTAIVGEAVGTGDGVTTDFSLGFDIPTNATIFVDGVEAQGVTVDCNRPYRVDDMGEYFMNLAHSCYVSVFKPSGNSVSSEAKDFKGNYAMTIWYNPFYEQGISEVNVIGGATLECSNDLETWYTIHACNTSAAYEINTVSIPLEYQNYKYYRGYNGYTSNMSSKYYCDAMKNATYPTKENVHFATPPADGAVITANYTPKCIAKDANHVFDFSFEIQLGEYTE